MKKSSDYSSTTTRYIPKGCKETQNRPYRDQDTALPSSDLQVLTVHDGRENRHCVAETRSIKRVDQVNFII